MGIIGSGVMAQNLSEDVGVKLILNQIATVLALGISIALFGKISGAHFNPVVTWIALFKKHINAPTAIQYILAQFAGGAVGALLTNLMYGLPAINISQHQRSGTGLLIGEVIATAGLILVIEYVIKSGANPAILVPTWIGAALFFTSSTSFANPAVTLSRAFSDTFAGIAIGSVGGFVLAQLIGSLIGWQIGKRIFN